MPEFEFYLDETLDELFKIEELFKKIHEEDEKIAKNS
jgi:ribosome-binding factor A